MLKVNLSIKASLSVNNNNVVINVAEMIKPMLGVLNRPSRPKIAGNKLSCAAA